MGCENLYRMILNILEISKIEEGRMILNKKSFQIDEIIKESIKKIKTIAKQNEICVTMEVKGEAESVNADQEIIERVLLNLLLNAISFSPPQSEIKIIAEPEGEKDFLKVSVADQGKGIPEEFTKKKYLTNSGRK
jgi:K+-sensing histidine kinase KdpD